VSTPLPFPDAEQVVRDYLADTLGVRVLNELPADLVGALPVIRVIRIQGGFEGRAVDDHANVDVDVFAATRDAMWQLTYAMRAQMRTLPGRSVRGTTVDDVEVVNGSGQIPYANPAVRRSITTFRLTCRAQAPA
jgi:hypothetical protein